MKIYLDIQSISYDLYQKLSVHKEDTKAVYSFPFFTLCNRNHSKADKFGHV